MSKKFRIAVINSHPIQYFAPLYDYLSRDPRLEITALYCSDSSLRGAIDPGFKKSVQWDIDLLKGYRSKFLGQRFDQRVPDGFLSLVCPEVWREIRTGGYDAVWIHGYGYAVNLIAVLAAKSIGIPVYVRSETHLALQRSGWRRKLRDLIVGTGYRYLDGFLAIGTGNSKYYESLGIPSERIFTVPYTVDNERFAQGARLAEQERSAFRLKLGLKADEPVIIYASKFMRRKHPDDLIEAFSMLRKRGRRAGLLMVGTGEMEESLRQRVRELKLDNVVFAGFANQSELPRLFGVSDVFVLPSENEPWGLIVNEAMAAGLPVIVSSEVGCTVDLVIDGRSGLKFPCGDVAALAKALEKLVSDPVQLAAMSAGAREVIGAWSYEQCRVGVLKSLGVTADLRQAA